MEASVPEAESLEESAFLLFKPSKAANEQKSSTDAASVRTAVPEQHFDTLTVEDLQLKPTHERFGSLGMSPWQIEALEGLAIHRPTTIQQACIPAVLEGRSVLGASKTGSGKTAAFALPILKALSEEMYGPFALILTPTRELALQIAEQFQVLGKGIRAQVSVVLGGVDIIKQITALSHRPHIIVATPGRLHDLLQSGAFEAQTLRHLRYCVLDEADRLLDPSSTFQTLKEIPSILAALPAKTQMLFFSATVSSDVESFFAEHCKRTATRGLLFKGNTEYGTATRIAQTFLLVPSQVRDCYLFHLLQNDFAGKSLIIFVGKCKTCELMRFWLRELGMDVAALHSQLKQNDRLAALARFKSGQLKILVCTDVGSRGLDIPAVDAVINYDVPLDARDYVHRIGRTGRAGKSGLALTLATELDLELIEAIESRIGKSLDERPEPPEAAVLALLNKVTTAKRTASATLLDRNFGEKREVNRKKWANFK